GHSPSWSSPFVQGLSPTSADDAFTASFVALRFAAAAARFLPFRHFIHLLQVRVCKELRHHAEVVDPRAEFFGKELFAFGFPDSGGSRIEAHAHVARAEQSMAFSDP